MQYLFQFGIIAAVSFAGEVLKFLIPLPVPASIYGLLIMLILLCSGILKLEKIEAVSGFLINIMPLMFVPAVCGLVESYKTILPQLLQLAVIIVVTTVIVMAVCGWITQLILRRKEKVQDE